MHCQGWIGLGTTWANETNLGWNIAPEQYRSLNLLLCSPPRYLTLLDGHRTFRGKSTRPQFHTGQKRVPEDFWYLNPYCMIIMTELLVSLFHQIPVSCVFPWNLSVQRDSLSIPQYALIYDSICSKVNWLAFWTELFHNNSIYGSISLSVLTLEVLVTTIDALGHFETG